MDIYFENQQIPKLTKEEDPFWDPPEPMLIGKAYYALSHLANLFDNEFDAKIIDASWMQAAGRLIVNLVPTDCEGIASESPISEKIESPEDLLGEWIDFFVKVKEAKGLPEDLCWDPFITFGFYLDPKEKIPAVKGVNWNPVYNYSKQCSVDVTPEVLQYLKNDSLSFSVYAYPTIIEKSGKQESKKEIQN